MVATERLKSGLGTSLEITEAQRNFEDAATRLFEARYQAKLTETEVLKMNGKLIEVTP
jgi:outer membrane protein TolC